jgi:hypothetical protein
VTLDLGPIGHFLTLQRASKHILENVGHDVVAAGVLAEIRLRDNRSDLCERPMSERGSAKLGSLATGSSAN